MRVLGIMSGTSLDGVDYVVCSIKTPREIRFEDHWSAEFPGRLRAALHRAASNLSTAYEIGELHHELGRFYAAGAKGIRVALAGLHGQTVFHSPGKATLQLGEAAYLAEQLDVPVVANFRAADIAAGGQGAPLATIFHQHVFARKGRQIAVNNLGGISNVTSLDWKRGKSPKVTAFDTGPANILIDMAVRHFSKGRAAFDRDGNSASKGEIDAALLADLLKDPFFAALPPKSTGREYFGEAFLKKLIARNLPKNDLLATLTELTARSIALNYVKHLPSFPDEVILCGGGSQNPFLFARIAGALRDVRSNAIVRGSLEYGWHPQVIEGAAFALLAWLAWNARAGNVPATTGAKGPRVLGQITSSAPRRSR